MTKTAEKLLRQAIKLPAQERAALVAGLADSLTPQTQLDALWLKEAESRIAAYRTGEIGSVDVERMFAEFGQKL